MASFTQADLDAINAAFAMGALEVRYADGRLARYRSLAEMQTIRATIAADLAGVTRTLADDRVVTGYNNDLSRGAPTFGRFSGC